MNTAKCLPGNGIADASAAVTMAGRAGSAARMLPVCAVPVSPAPPTCSQAHRWDVRCLGCSHSSAATACSMCTGIAYQQLWGRDTGLDLLACAPGPRGQDVDLRLRVGRRTCQLLGARILPC